MQDVNNISQGNGVNKEEQVSETAETINSDADRWLDTVSQ